VVAGGRLTVQCPEVVYGHGGHLVSTSASARYNETRRLPNIDLSPIVPLKMTSCMRSRSEANTNVRPSVQVAAKVMDTHQHQVRWVGRECGVEQCGMGEWGKLEARLEEDPNDEGGIGRTTTLKPAQKWKECRKLKLNLPQ
jgi:hypothetical protein